jgi:hypothetical protein
MGCARTTVLVYIRKDVMININAAVFSEAIVNHCAKYGAKVLQFSIFNLPGSLRAVVLATDESEYMVWDSHFHPQDHENACKGLGGGFYTKEHTTALEEYIDRINYASKRAHSKE